MGSPSCTGSRGMSQHKPLLACRTQYTQLKLLVHALQH
jgi:hypothetical protein